MITDQIGETLRKAREAKGVSASEAAQATRIKVQHLQEMERGDFTRIPAHTYARGFIRIYAQYLDIDPSPLVGLYNRAAEGRTGPASPAPVASAPPPDTRAAAASSLSRTPVDEAADIRPEPLPPDSGSPPPPGPRGPSPWSRFLAGLQEHRDALIRIAAAVAAVLVVWILIDLTTRGLRARRAARTPDPVAAQEGFLLPLPPGPYAEPLPGADS